MKMTISSYAAGDLLSQIAEKNNLAIQEDCQRHSVMLPKRLGDGDIITYTINNSFEAFLFRGQLKSDWEITFQSKAKAPVSFFTLANGLFQQIHPNKSFDDLTLEPMQSAICSPPKGGTATWFLPKQMEITFAAIYIYKETFFQNIDCDTLQIPTDLIEVLYDINGQKNFLFDDIYYLPIVKALQEVLEQEDIGLLNSTFATAKLFEILFMQLQQYQHFQQNGETSIVRPDQGLTLIRNAENILITRLQDPPTIPELAKMSGINQQTLKKGFKQLYGRTINQYLNAKRLEQAEMLIKNGDLRMQEVALEVGYGNPSYFSRKFKERYGIAPKNYAQQIA